MGAFGALPVCRVQRTPITYDVSPATMLFKPALLSYRRNALAARMPALLRIIALLFAFVLAGCTGNRLNAETKPTAVALCAPSVAAAFAAT